MARRQQQWFVLKEWPEDNRDQHGNQLTSQIAVSRLMNSKFMKGIGKHTTTRCSNTTIHYQVDETPNKTTQCGMDHSCEIKETPSGRTMHFRFAKNSESTIPTLDKQRIESGDWREVSEELSVPSEGRTCQPPSQGLEKEEADGRKYCHFGPHFSKFNQMKKVLTPPSHVI